MKKKIDESFSCVLSSKSTAFEIEHHYSSEMSMAARRGSASLFFLPSLSGAAAATHFFCNRGAAAVEFLEIFLLFLSKKSVMLEIIILR